MATISYEDDEEAFADDEVESSDSEEEVAGSGMGQAMARILGSEVPSGADPVLAKRKTPMMKALDEREKEAVDMKKRKVEKEASKKKSKAVIKTDSSKLNFERSLRKTATRAVVALFNAINEHQRGTDDVTSFASESTAKSKKRDRAAKYGLKVAAAKDVQRKTAAAIHDLNAKDQESRLVPAEDDDDVPANSWARDDYLLDAGANEWDDDDDAAANDDTTKAKKPTRKDGKEHAFLYSTKDNGSSEKKKRHRV